MITLAVTGGIGSGKSFITGMLSVMGCPVYDTDSRTRGLYSESDVLRNALTRILGDGVFRDGKPDTCAMAGLLFSNSELLGQVEAAVYPVLLEDLDGWLDECRSRGTEVAVVESALILEKELFRHVTDRVLTVSAPEDIRVKRAMARDRSDVEQVRRRIGCQKTDGWREERSDYIIFNDGRPLLPQLAAVFEDIRPHGSGYVNGL